MSAPSLYIFSDMDRTLIPNGPHEESLLARPLLRKLCESDEVCLTYVSGRDQKLIRKAISEYGLPEPDYAIGDVGTSLFRVKKAGHWVEDEQWHRHLQQTWDHAACEAIAVEFAKKAGWRLQEPAKQSPYKISFYMPLDMDSGAWVEQLSEMLRDRGLRFNLVHSVDEEHRIGLLDILPEGADKLQSIQFLKNALTAQQHNSVFAGDSGNDMSVLTSDIHSILVANASDDVREQAHRIVLANDLAHTLYCAEGDWMQMNGHYAAGVLEGLAHFIPGLEGDLQTWMHKLPKRYQP